MSALPFCRVCKRNSVVLNQARIKYHAICQLKVGLGMTAGALADFNAGFTIDPPATLCTDCIEKLTTNARDQLKLALE